MAVLTAFYPPSLKIQTQASYNIYNFWIPRCSQDSWDIKFLQHVLNLLQVPQGLHPVWLAWSRSYRMTGWLTDAQITSPVWRSPTLRSDHNWIWLVLIFIPVVSHFNCTLEVLAGSDPETPHHLQIAGMSVFGLAVLWYPVLEIHKEVNVTPTFIKETQSRGWRAQRPIRLRPLPPHQPIYPGEDLEILVPGTECYLGPPARAASLTLKKY